MKKKIIPLVWLGEKKEISYEKNLVKRGEEVIIFMLLLGKNDQTVNVKIKVRHQAPETTSQVIVKGVLTDSAHVDFAGLVKIEPDAKGSNTWLAAHLLLLSGQASGRAFPSLEIAENDVQAGHATTIGRVNDEELFYLMTRGLPKKTAIRLIARGFLDSLLDQFPANLARLVKKEILNI